MLRTCVLLLIFILTAGSDIIAIREIACIRGCLIIGRSSHLVPGTLLPFPTNKSLHPCFGFWFVTVFNSVFLEQYFVTPVIFHIHILFARFDNIKFIVYLSKMVN